MVVGQAIGNRVGSQVLADGGNAIDAIVAASLAAAIAAPGSTGIGGYGMSAIVAFDGGKRIVSIDGNTVAPASMPKDLFRSDLKGSLPDGLDRANFQNSIGWLSAGVPGILAGLQLALEQFGTRSFAELVLPAIALARDGVVWPKGLATAVRSNKMLQTDFGSKKLYFPNGTSIAEGEPFKNPELAAMLTALAQANSVDAFYRGDIAHQISDAYRKNGGLVTSQDLANYQARIVEPIAMKWESHSIHTAPLTAGGLSVLQMLMALQALEWKTLPAGIPRTHARIEAMRLAWRDRLALLGDPEFSDVPTVRLLSREYAMESADRILAVVKAGKLLAHNIVSRQHSGTIHLNAADKDGNFAALTLTHGNGFGACVTVDGLGLTLGHGMSRFDPNPSHPNGPAPGKRPLHNMVPTIVTRDGRPILAVGGTGGRKIPNGLFEVLLQFLVNDQPIENAMASPRMHTEGNTSLSFEKSWPAADMDALRKLGYAATFEGSAKMSAIALEKSVFSYATR